MATQAQAGDLEVSLLRMFSAVVEHGSIGKAAAAVSSPRITTPSRRGC